MKTPKPMIITSLFLGAFSVFSVAENEI